MSIQQLSDGRKHTRRQMFQHVFSGRRFPFPCGQVEHVRALLGGAIPRIGRDRLHRSPAIFEGNKPVLIGISTAEIKRSKPRFLRFRDRIPEKKVHASQVREARVTSSILVNKGIFVTQRDDCRYGSALVYCYSNLEIVTKAINQVREPSARRRRQSVPFSCNGKKIIEPVEELRIGTVQARQAFPFRAPDFSLNGVLVAPVENRRNVGTQIYLMKCVPHLRAAESRHQCEWS